MDTYDTPDSPDNEQQGSASFIVKKAPHVVILPDGSKPLPLGSGTIESILGIGGMSNVYEIWNTHLEVHRAVKLLHPNCSLDSNQRFETEIKITAKLDHPNIVEIHAVGEWNGLPFIEMEKVDGYTLDKLITDRGGLAMDICTSIGILIGRALRYAHNHEYALYGQTYHGIIHRDLKPSNIMVAHSGVVKLMDFGVARPIDASIHTTDNSSVLGTMQYLSPELLEGKSADIRTDFYSLGAVLYEALTGTKAFPEGNISTLMMRKIKNEYQPLDSFAVAIPPRLKRLVHKCMNRDRDKRPANSDELLAELARIHKGVTLRSPEVVMTGFMTTVSGAKTVISQKMRLPKKHIAVVCIVAALVVMAGFMVRYVKKHPRLTATPPPAAAVVPPPQDMPSVKNVSDAMLGKKKRTTVPVSAAERDARSAAGLKKSRQPDLVIAELKQQYGTDDLADIFTREVKIGHHQQAQKVYDLLTPQQKESKAVVLYELRLFDAIGERGRFAQLLAVSAIEDGEFYLARARQFFRENNTAKCLSYLDLSAKTRCTFLSPATLRQDMLYYRALCYSREFESHPSKMTMQNALDSWFEVKLLFRAMPEHNYFQKAINEMQRIGDKGKELKG
jgi:serine/threonine-protein kinase